MQPASHEPRLLYLDPRHLEPDDDNVRRDPGDLAALADSLRRYGVLQPLGVAPAATRPAAGTPGRVPDHDGHHDASVVRQYRVVYGNRRRVAAILAGLPAVPCIQVAVPEGPGRLVAQLLENLQRRELNDMEKAEGLARLRRHLAVDRAPGGRDGAAAEELDERVAELVGFSPRTVRRYLALRDLPPAVRDLLAEERLTVTQAQHLGQLPAAHLQEQVAARAADEGWTAAQVSRVCAALVRAPGLALDQAVQAAGDGWQAVEGLGAPPKAAPAAALARPPRVTRPAAEGEAQDDADLWQEDATGAPTPERTGEPDPFAAPGRAGRGAAHGAAPETADGHRVFRIRTLPAFCDEVDRLARCIQDGDLARAIQGDTSAPTRLRLAARQLRFTLERVEAMLAG